MVNYALQPYLYYSGGYNAIPASVVAAAGVTYERGVTDELDLQKGLLNFRIIDDNDTYRPTNPESPLYGIIGPYLPMLYKIDGVNRFAGEIDALDPGQTDDHQTVAKVTSKGVRWVDFKATGPLGTVGRWRDQIASPLFTQITKGLTTVRAYWPGEDGSDALLMSAATAGVAPATVAGVSFAAAPGPAGSNPLLVINSGGLIQGKFPPGISSSGWQIQFATNCNGADATERQIFAWTTSNGYTWSWRASTTTFHLEVLDVNGTSVFSSSWGNGGIIGKNIVFRLKNSISAGTWTTEPAWYTEDSPVLVGATATFAGSAGAPTTWVTGANTVMVGAYFGHLLVTSGVSESLQTYAMLNAINAYPGETTSDRLNRIMVGRSIPIEILGDTTKAIQMGQQRPGTVQDQLKEIRQTEFGLIFESPDGRGLRLALRNYLQDQANNPALSLTYPADIGPGMAELSTTLELYNTIIATDRSGISATAVEPNGRYGTADPPNGSGVVDKEIKVNLNNPADVAQIANLALRYHQQVTRFDTITIDLDANPGLRTAVEAADVGKFIRLSGRTPDPLLLMIVRVGGRTMLTRHIVTFDVVPGDVFATGTYSSSQRYDLQSSTLSGALTSTATTITMTMTRDNEAWSTAAAMQPYDLMIAGERITIPVGAMGARTGTGPWSQTATGVTRSVNGVVKAQSAGAEVHVADDGVWG